MMSDRRGKQRYPRTARVNEVLREVVAEALEEVSQGDERLELVTVTGVETEPDLRHATVFYSARHPEADTALEEHRVRVQGAIARQTRMKRTPQLAFEEDPGIREGWKVEQILKDLREDEGRGPEPGA